MIFIFIFWISPVAAFLFFLAVYSCSFNWSFIFSMLLLPCFWLSAFRFASSCCSFLDWYTASRLYKSYLSKSNFCSKRSKFILCCWTYLIKFSISFSPSSICFFLFLISDYLIVCSFFISFNFLVIFSSYLLFSWEYFYWFFSISSWIIFIYRAISRLSWFFSYSTIYVYSSNRVESLHLLNLS